MNNVIITGIDGRAIYNYKLYASCIEFYSPGTVCTITDENEIKKIKTWIKQSKQFAKNNAEICTYLEYMIEYGQYEEEV